MTTRLPRKPVLLGLIVLFVIGNLLIATASGYELAMIGRVVAALSHGAYFGIGSVVASGLVAPQKQAAAIAIMFTGLTAANVFGVPFGAFTYIAYTLTTVTGFASTTVPWLLVLFGAGLVVGNWAGGASQTARSTVPSSCSSPRSSSCSSRSGCSSNRSPQ